MAIASPTLASTMECVRRKERKKSSVVVPILIKGRDVRKVLKFVQEVNVAVVNVCLLQVPRFTSANANSPSSLHTARPFQYVILIHVEMEDNASRMVMTLTVSALQGTGDVSAMLAQMTAMWMMASHIVVVSVRQMMVMNASSGTLTSSSIKELIPSHPSRTQMDLALTTSAEIQMERKSPGVSSEEART